jgi:SAM-dependent methyltransferase
MKRVVAALKGGIKKSGLLPSFQVREKLAAKYLRGAGLEIGALNFPLKTPPGLIVKYVDYATREENIGKFPELAARIVATDHIENGFELSSFADRSQDFIIANHVLEHADNPIRVLLNWKRLLRPGGVLLVTVPVAERCFDKGREETSLEHLVEDYQLMAAGDLARFRDRNRRHFLEVLQISQPADLRSKGSRVPELTASALKERLAEMMDAERTDIHFHTFSIESYARFMEYFVAQIAPDLELKELKRSRGGAEVVAILKNKDTQ